MIVISAYEESFAKLHLHHQGFLDDWYGFNWFRFNIKLLRALYFNWHFFSADLHHDLVDIILASKKP